MSSRNQKLSFWEHRDCNYDTSVTCHLKERFTHAHIKCVRILAKPSATTHDHNSSLILNDHRPRADVLTLPRELKKKTGLSTSWSDPN